MFKIIREEPYFAATGRAVGSLSWKIVPADQQLDSADIRVILGNVNESSRYERLEDAIAHVALASAHVGGSGNSFVTILSETMSLADFRQSYGKAAREAHLKGLKGTAAVNWLGKGFDIPDDEAIAEAEAKGWVYPW
jgi:hypothetical protein